MPIRSNTSVCPLVSPPLSFLPFLPPFSCSVWSADLSKGPTTELNFQPPHSHYIESRKKQGNDSFYHIDCIGIGWINETVALPVDNIAFKQREETILVFSLWEAWLLSSLKRQTMMLSLLPCTGRAPQGRIIRGSLNSVRAKKARGIYLRNTWTSLWKYEHYSTQMKRWRGLSLLDSLSKYFEIMETPFLPLSSSMLSSLSNVKEPRKVGLPASSISKVSYPVPSLGEVEFYLFLSVWCSLKASWIIKPVIFQACKCVQCVAHIFRSQRTDRS